MKNRTNFLCDFDDEQKKEYFDLLEKRKNEEKVVTMNLLRKVRRLVNVYREERWVEAEKIPLSRRFVPQLVRKHLLLSLTETPNLNKYPLDFLQKGPKTQFDYANFEELFDEIHIPSPLGIISSVL